MQHLKRKVSELVESFIHLQKFKLMSSEATYQFCVISDEILDGIYPKNMPPPEEKSFENARKLV